MEFYRWKMFSDASASEILESHHEIQRLKEEKEQQEELQQTQAKAQKLSSQFVSTNFCYIQQCHCTRTSALLTLLPVHSIMDARIVPGSPCFSS